MKKRIVRLGVGNRDVFEDLEDDLLGDELEALVDQQQGQDDLLAG